MTKITAQLSELNARKSTVTAEIVITVLVKNNPSVSNAKFDVSYIVPNTFWYPTYDLRVPDITSPILAQMNAKVQQNSGEDWREVKLTLSTGEPKLTGVKPELGKWFLGENGNSFFIGQTTSESEDFEKMRLLNKKTTINGRLRDETGEALVGVSVVIKGSNRGTVTGTDGDFSLEIEANDRILVVSYVGFNTQEIAITNNPFFDVVLTESAQVLSEVVVVGYGTTGAPKVDYQIRGKAAGVSISKEKKVAKDEATVPLVIKETQKATTTAFEVELPYTILSDNKEYQVAVKEEILTAFYQYAVAPKLDSDAFLTAFLPDWEKYNLLEAEANLYFEGSYLGKTLLKANTTDDTLKISLGRDKNVVVKRTKLKEFSKSRFLSSRREETRTFEIVVKNKKSTPLSILVEEQVPVSTDKSVEVNFDAGDAKVDKELGRLTWLLTLKPFEESKKKFSYTVKHDGAVSFPLE